uniref:Katanin p80 subunit C-terminal domain-containing protein n=1 Tax=Strongyloides stercoralis TaxID=6248 RepID=A0A0K0EK01_STRER
MENFLDNSSFKQDTFLTHMGSASSSNSNTSSSTKSKNVKKFSSKVSNNYSLRNRSSSVGNLKGKIKNEFSNNNNSIQRNRSLSKKEKNYSNCNLPSERVIPKFSILSKKCISSNESDLEQLDIINSQILTHGLGILLSYKFRTNYFINIIEAVTENEKLWCIENVELLIPQLLSLIMSKSLKNKILSLKIIQRIIKDFSDVISSDNKSGKKVKEGLIQYILSQERLITSFDNQNINFIDFICDKTFFEECTTVLGQCCNEVINEFQNLPKTIENKNREIYFYETCETAFAQCIRSKYMGFCNVYYQLTQYVPIYVRSLLKRIEI